MSDNRGRSSLGLCHPRFDVARFIKTFDNATEMRFGFLDNFFNEKNSNNAVVALRVPKKKFVRVHVINGPGMTNGRTCPHEITYGETHASLVAKIEKGDKEFMRKFRSRLNTLAYIFGEARGETEFAVSPWLERKEVPAPVFEKLAREIREALPQVSIVDNPRDPSVSFIFGQNYLRERHGDHPNPNALDIVDLDGTDFEFVDIPKFMRQYANCKAVMLWGLGENGLWAAESWKPPQQRTGWTSSREYPCYRNFVAPNADERAEANPVDKAKAKKMLNPHDGYKQDFIWKLGEWKKTAVIVMPRRFRARFKKVEIWKDGKLIDRPKYRAVLNDGSGRLIYDCLYHPTKYPKASVLVAAGYGWVLDYPAYRID